MTCPTCRGKCYTKSHGYDEVTCGDCEGRGYYEACEKCGEPLDEDGDCCECEDDEIIPTV